MFEALLTAITTFISKIEAWMTNKDQKDQEQDDRLSQLTEELSSGVTALGEQFVELKQQTDAASQAVAALTLKFEELDVVSEPLAVSMEAVGSSKAGEEQTVYLTPSGFPDALRLLLNGDEIFSTTNTLDLGLGTTVDFSFTNPEGQVVLQAFVDKDGEPSASYTLDYDAGLIDITPGPNVSIEVVNKGSLIEGDKGFLEAIITIDGVPATGNVAGLSKVDFYVNGSFENPEKNWRYESWPTIPNADTLEVYAVAEINGVEYTSPIASFDIVSSTPIDPDPGVGEWHGLEQYDTIIFGNDGYPDPDDISSIVIQGLYAEALGILDNFHIFAGNHLNDPGPAAHEMMLAESLTFIANRGVKTHNFRADDNWMEEMQYYTALLSSGKVLVLAGGPMAVLHYALKSISAEQRANITVVSHSEWNEDRDKVTDLKIPAKTWADCKEDYPEVRYVDISDQNGWGSQSKGFNNSAWSELQDTGIEILEQAWETMGGATVGGNADKQHDASDFGMLFAAANEGKEDGEPSDVIPFLVDYFEEPLPVDPEIPIFSSYGDSGVYGIAMAKLAKQNPVVWYTEYEGEQNDLDDDYVTFMGNDAFASWQSSSKVMASIEVAETGTYIIEAFNRSGDKNSTSDLNDTWVRIHTEEFYAEKDGLTPVYAKGNTFGKSPVTSASDSSQGAFKIYTDTMGEWDLATYAVDSQKRQLKVDLVAGQIYMFEVSGRSRGHSIHSFWIRKEGYTTQADIEPYLPTQPEPGGGGGNEPVGIERFDDFLANADGSWYDWEAKNLPLGPMNGDALEGIYNVNDHKIGKPDPRVFVDDIEFEGETIRAVNFVATKESDGFWDRMTVPKDDRHAPAAPKIATSFTFLTLPGAKTGNFDIDRKSYGVSHSKGFGFQGPDGPPPPGENPVGANSPSLTNDPCEFVLWSSYSEYAMSQNNNRGNKGDQTAVEIGQPTSFNDASMNGDGPLNWDDRYYVGVGLYARDVYDYKHQSQIFACLPNPDGSISPNRLLFKVGEKYENYFEFAANTHNADGSHNSDGYFYWWIKNRLINGGKPFLAAKLTNRTFTTQYVMKFAKAGAGWYFNPGDSPNNAAGFYFTQQKAYYQL